MRILDLVLKDLVQISRDKKSVAFLVIMPIIITIFMGMAYGSGESEATTDSRLSLAWVEEGSDSEVSEALHMRLEESGMIKLETMEEDAAVTALQNHKVDGILVVPAGFALLPEQYPEQQLKLLADPSTDNGQSLYQELRVTVSQLMSAVEIGRMSADLTGDPAEFNPAFQLAWEKWGQGSSRSLVKVEQAVAIEEKSWFGDNPYNQASPGILVQFAIMGLITSAQILVQERKDRTLQRLVTTSMQPWQILTGHMLAMFAVVFLQTVILVVFGQLILDVNYLREPLATLMVSIALGLWVASMGLLIGVVAKTDEHVTLYSMMAMFIFSALGGAWFSLETAGSVFSTIGKTLPSAWAITGLQNILIRGLDLSSVIGPVSFLMLYTAGFLLLAVWRLRSAEL